MHRIEDLFTLVTELRADMNRQFTDVNGQVADVRENMHRQVAGVNGHFVDVREEMHRQFTDLRAEAHRDFRWLVGIQLTTMAAVIAALVGVLMRP